MPSPHRRSRLLHLLVLAIATSVAVPSVAAAALPSTTRASLDSSGAQVGADSSAPSVSADGRWVAFVSLGALVPADTNGNQDIYLRDRQTGQTRQISVGPGGVQSNGGSDQAGITPDGRYVVFRSNADNLVAGMTGTADFRLFRYDRTTQSVALVPVPPSPYVSPYDPSMSDDGNRVAFRAQTSSSRDIFVADLRAGTARRVSETAAGAPASPTSLTHGSFDPDISGDGHWVAFTTEAANLAVETPSNGYRDIVERNLETGAFTAISSPGGVQENSHSSTPSLSRDGCVVAFFSSATNLVAEGPSPVAPKVFVRNRCTGDTEIASESNAGVPGTADVPIDLSADGCRVVFRSSTVASPVPSAGDAAVLRDRCTGTTSRLDLATTGDPGAGNVTDVSISGGTGRFTAFSTPSGGLVGDDTNTRSDAFVRDLATNTPPSALLSLTLTDGVLTADASGSSDPDGFVLTGSISYGDGSPAQAGLRGTHTYARAGTYGVIATVTDADGVSSSQTAAVTVPDPNAVPPPAPAPGGGVVQPPGPGVLAAPLVLDRVALSRTRWAVVAKGKRPDARHGSTLTLRLSAPATVTVRFQRVRPGRRVKGRCIAGAHRGARCTSLGDEGTITRTLPAGTSTVALTGRLGPQALAAGTHRLVVSARTADGRSARSKALTLTVVRATRKAA